MDGFNLRKANKLLRFVHLLKAENNGILESWNDGFKETNIQIGYDFIGVHVLIEYVSGKTRNRCYASIIKSRFNIFCKMELTPLFVPSIPEFHYSIIPLGLPREWPQKIS